MSASEPLDSGAEPVLRICAQLTGLTAIFEPGINAVVLPRALQDELVDYLENPAVHQALGTGLRTRVRCGEPLPEDALPAMPGRDAFRADIHFLTEILADLLDCDQVGLRLEVLHKAMCPRFHVDRVGIRLLCCYRGSGTEYLTGAQADRSKLALAACDSDEASRLILDPTAIQRVPRHAITLIKGNAWPGNGAHGAIHRSPAVLPEHAPRIVLALDAIWA